MRRAIGITLVFALGAVLGPIFLAAAFAIFPAQTRFQSAQDEEIGLLVKAYQEQLPAGLLFLSVKPPPMGKECGYEPDEIFPETFEEVAASVKQGKSLDTLDTATWTNGGEIQKIAHLLKRLDPA